MTWQWEHNFYEEWVEGNFQHAGNISCHGFGEGYLDFCFMLICTFGFLHTFLVVCYTSPKNKRKILLPSLKDLSRSLSYIEIKGNTFSVGLDE